MKPLPLPSYGDRMMRAGSASTPRKAACHLCGSNTSETRSSQVDHRTNYFPKPVALCVNTAACDARRRDR